MASSPQTSSNFHQGLVQGQRQSQNLALTPQLQQAIKILQYNNAELATFVGDALDRNPLLDQASDVGGDAPNPAGAAKNTAGYQALGEGGGWQKSSRKSAFGDEDEDWISQLTETKHSLYDHLSAQIQEMIVYPKQCVIALHLLDSLDEAGYVRTPLGQIAQTLGTTYEAVEQVLHLLQECEPAGVFARDLAECLGLQLQAAGEMTPAFAALLGQLDLVAAGKITALAKGCDLKLDAVKLMLTRLRKLNPKPGLAYGGERNNGQGPDVLIRANVGESSQFSVELNPDTLPKVLVNVTYYQQVKDQARNKEDCRYLEECLQSANWLTKTMHQRAVTIIKVVGEIVRRQEAFLQHGLAYLKPMTLKDVAEAVGVHESTVSRVTANKTALTPRGVMSLKLFFSARVGDEEDGGWSHSSGAIKDQIRQLVAAEGQTGKVLSDDALAIALGKTGVAVARRTVAKYREALGIADSALRKRAIRRQ
jgi:RNA polymerase sigma-54 factor